VLKGIASLGSTRLSQSAAVLKGIASRNGSRRESNSVGKGLIFRMLLSIIDTRAPNSDPILNFK